jgi:hypothetical protein
VIRIEYRPSQDSYRYANPLGMAPLAAAEDEMEAWVFEWSALTKRSAETLFGFPGQTPADVSLVAQNPTSRRDREYKMGSVQTL